MRTCQFLHDATGSGGSYEYCKVDHKICACGGTKEECMNGLYSEYDYPDENECQHPDDR
jgi:hypothetical protein